MTAAASRNLSRALLVTAVVALGALGLVTVVPLRPGADDDCRWTEQFTNPGNPADHGAPDDWRLNTEENPAQDWDSVAAGDGLARLTVDDSAEDDDGGFQTISWAPIVPYGSLEVRMRGAVLPGYVGFIFTYTEPGDDTFDEIDLEIVADDRNTDRSVRHLDTSDLRLNMWTASDALDPPLPDTYLHTPIQAEDAVPGTAGDHHRPVSHFDDGLFHTYSVDWYRAHADFYVDGVFQGRVSSPAGGAPDRPAALIVGLRDVSFGGPNIDRDGRPIWTGSRTVEIDFVRVCNNGVIDRQQPSDTPQS